MKKALLSNLAVICFLFGVFITPAYAQEPSVWAVDTIEESEQLGFVPPSFLQNYQDPVTREEFAELSVRFLMMQYNYDSQKGTIAFLNDICGARLRPDGEALVYDNYYSTEPFTDAAGEFIQTAYFLGIINGKGNNLFDPDGYITRQEAAVMLTRVYRLYCSESSIISSTNQFADEKDIADWARESVSEAVALGVMDGIGNNVFSPTGTYNWEQCITTFVRLYKQAPTSRFLENVQPIISYTEKANQLKTQSLPTFSVQFEKETANCVILYGSLGGVMHLDKIGALYIVYKAGGYREISLPGSGLIDELILNESETELYFKDSAGNEYVVYLDASLNSASPSTLE